MISLVGIELVTLRDKGELSNRVAGSGLRGGDLHLG